MQHEANEIARYGDLIEVTNPARVDFGKRMQVATAGDIAVTALDNRIRVAVDHEDYKVVRRCGHPATSSAPAKPVKKAAPARAEVPAVERPRAIASGFGPGAADELEKQLVDDGFIDAPRATDDEVAALISAFDSVKPAEPAPVTQEQIDAAVENLQPLYGIGEEPDPLPSLATITQEDFDEMTKQDDPHDDKVDAAIHASKMLAAWPFPSKPASILDEAAKIIDGDRESTHGDPGRNLRTIARYWSAHLSARYRVAIRLDVDDIAIMMTGLKLARLANNTKHRDSQIDACGYMRLLERVQTEGKKA